MKQNKLSQLNKIAKQSIASAGPRYTPGQEANAPNILIRNLEQVVEGILCGAAFRKRVNEFAEKLSKDYDTLIAEISRSKTLRIKKPARSIELLKQIAIARPENTGNLISRLKKCLSRHLLRVNEIGSKLSDSIESLSSSADNKVENPELRKFENHANYLRNYKNTVSEIERFASSSECSVQLSPRLLLLGAWGSGKTHLLADMSRKLLKQGMPVLFVLAKDFSTKPSPLVGLTKHSQFSTSFINLLGKLNKLGKEQGVRSLLIIDGVNESIRTDWKQILPRLVRLLEQKKNVGLILSCRTPFEQDIFSASSRRQFVTIHHQGFFDIEFDAQSEFFKYYSIPLPDVPLLAEEFSRPLTLKVLCQAFHRLPKKKRSKGFHQITSGQRGMTFILETFVNSLGESIEKELSLPPKYCWNLIKGRDWINDDETSGVAPWMASRLQDFIPVDNCINIILADSRFSSRASAERLCQRLITEGLLIEERKWIGTKTKKYITTIRLPYERFGDHIIARHLLKRHLNTHSSETIKRSFYANRPLGKIFKVRDKGATRFAMPGWAEAVIVEFPERTGKYLPNNEKELFFYLPKKQQNLSAYLEPCIDGMFWRTPKSICYQTDRLIGIYLYRWNEYARAKVFEVLFSIGTKAEHPYSGMRTFSNLEGMSMAERDLFWSETVRKRSGGSALDRLINWCELHQFENLSEKNVYHIIGLVSLLFTTTDRKLRDRATRVLVRIGEAHPRCLFYHTVRSLSFSDLYLPERMLASSYGVAMSQWAFPQKKDFHQMLVKFARVLVKEIFLPGGKLKSTHILIRDYALGIIGLAERAKPRCIASKHKKYLKPPFSGRRSRFPSASKIEEETLKDINDAIRGDFENYTVGRLVPDRRNYDMNNSQYRKCLDKIKWRIQDLGYSSKDFKFIDQMIGEDAFYRSQRESPKIDRYGKKYSWIAFFEMCGVLQAQGKLNRDFTFERLSDCDIDPSFPKPPPDFDSKILNHIVSEEMNDDDWLVNGPTPDHRHLFELENLPNCRSSGSWILLDGSISESGQKRLHSVFTHLHGYLVKNADFNRFQSNTRKLSHPEPDFPFHLEDHYTFSGEVPWSPRFASSRRKASGTYKAFNTESFVPTKYENRRRKIKKGWKLLLSKLGDVEKYFQPIRISVYGEEEQEDKEERRANKVLQRINSSLPKREQVHSRDFFEPRPSNKEVEAGYQVVQELIREPGVMVEPTAWRYSWESYHSLANDYQGFYFPSPVICETLNLLPFRREIELRDFKGNLASAYREFGDFGNHSYFLYLRKDLLDELLLVLDCKLVITAWGERQVHYERHHVYDDNSAVKKALQEYRNRYSTFYIYDSTVQTFSTFPD